jgi:ubiquinone/menaquinone biosynthesis C-methylase UbiE
MTLMTAADALDNAKTFDSWAVDYYEPIALRYYDRSIARMVKLLAPPAGGTVLDAGCGTGVHSIRAARLGHRVQAVDISAVAIERAKRFAEQAGVSGQIAFEQADLTKLRFADGAFETVFSWGVVIHIPEIEKALWELVRVTRPGGRIALQITNRRALDHRIEAAARFLLRKPEIGQEKREFGVGGWCDMHGGQLYNWKMDISVLTRHMQSLGCQRIYRGAAEFTELQRRIGFAPLRNLVRRSNNLYFNLRLPAALACTNLLVFQREES